ncbi:MAG TPA: lipoprotein [Acidobacteriota bacterium]|nr:lipoprotein [Acidobacteriota bacterium]
MRRILPFIVAALLLAGCNKQNLDPAEANNFRTGLNVARSVVGEMEAALENGALADWEHRDKALRILPLAKEGLDVLSRTLKLVAEGSKKEWVVFIEGQERIVTSPAAITLPDGTALTPLERPLTPEAVEAREAALSELIAEISDLLVEVREVLRDAD